MDRSCEYIGCMHVTSFPKSLELDNHYQMAPSTPCLLYLWGPLSPVYMCGLTALWAPRLEPTGLNGRERERERKMRERDGQWEEDRSLIDDSDWASWQMLLDQIEAMWVESKNKEESERRCVRGSVVEGEEQTDDKTDCRGNTRPAPTWLRQLRVTIWLSSSKNFLEELHNNKKTLCLILLVCRLEVFQTTSCCHLLIPVSEGTRDAIISC